MKYSSCIFGILLLGVMGCKAKHVATEAVAVEVTEEVNTTKEAEAMNASAWVAENIVVEKPVIEMVDSASGQRVTIRCERLARKQHSANEIKAASIRENNVLADAIAEVTTEQKSATEGNLKINFNPIFIVIVIIGFIFIVKKSA